MKSLKMFGIISVVMISLFLVTVIGFSYAYNPWTGMTGDGTLAVNPFVYTTGLSPLGLNSTLVANYGITSSIDVFAGADFTVVRNFSFNYGFIMPRMDLGGNNIVALQIANTYVSPQYHYFFENDMMALEANAYVNIYYGALGNPDIGGYITGVYKLINNLVYVYLELDPKYTIGTGFSLNVIPGLCLNMGNAGQVCLGISLGGIYNGITPNINAWYWIPFNLKSK